MFEDVNLGTGETKYFLYEDEIQEDFRVLSIHKVGELLIQVKKY